MIGFITCTLLRIYVISAITQQSHAVREGVCDDAVNAQLPFCNGSLDIDDRVNDLVTRIPLATVGSVLVNNASAIDAANHTLRLTAYQWWNEALHGVGISPGIEFKPPTPHPTSFPQVLTLAASFNKTLFYQIGKAIGEEARAFYNVGHGGLTFWAPNINILRDPRWGRGQETPGEDPLLTSEYAVAFVRGMQGEPNSTFLKVSAACKHFSSYSQEVPRHRIDAIVTKQDQADTYFPAFKACVERGRASGLMCSYNAVNGVPSCADKPLLTDTVRGRWDFDGYIVSDCGAVHDILYEHHFTQSASATCAATLKAGMDLNCGQFLMQHLLKAMEEGVVTKDDVLGPLKRLFRVQFRLGMFEKKPQPYTDLIPSIVDSLEHRELALDVARQGIVLLKNEDQRLPLSASHYGEDKKLALVGPHFNASVAFLGNSAGVPSTIVTPLQGVQAYVKNVSFALGCNVTISPGELPEFATVDAITRAADQVVVFIGLDQSQEREGIDRVTLKLPAVQRELVRRVIRVSNSPIILVVISGGCIDLSEYAYHPMVGAIVYTGYLGQAGGTAIADVLFGRANPSGRLPHTFYAEDFIETTSLYDMHMRPTDATGSQGRTYRFYRGTPVYEFGHGLSYTDFKISMEIEALPSHDSPWSMRVAVNVTNQGDRAGSCSLLLYAQPTCSTSSIYPDSRPRKQLIAFDNTRLLSPRGGKQAMSFDLSSAVFELADPDGNWVRDCGTWVLQVEGEHVEIRVPTMKNGRDDLHEATAPNSEMSAHDETATQAIE